MFLDHMEHGMKSRARAAFVLVLLAVSACATAHVKPGPIITDRPDFTESTETVPAGMVQVEGGYTLAAGGADRVHSIGELLVRVGVGSRSELRFDASSYTIASSDGETTRGFEDLGIGAKVKLVEEAEHPGSVRPALSLLLGTSLPTGARAYRERTLQPEIKLAAGWGLSERLSLGANLNHAWLSEGGRRFGQQSASASFGYSLSEKVGSYFEGFAFSPESPSGPTAKYVNGGLTYQVHDGLQLDARGGARVGAASQDYFVGVGLAWRVDGQR